MEQIQEKLDTHDIEFFKKYPGNIPNAFKYSIENDNIEHVKFLTENIPESINMVENYAVKFAAEYGNLEIFKYILNKYTIFAEHIKLLLIAAKNNHMDIVKYLIDDCETEYKEWMEATEDTDIKQCLQEYHKEYITSEYNKIIQN